MSEARTVREARLQVRDIESDAEDVHMAPAAALSWEGRYYLRRARLALRQAERAFAKADDPRLDPLEPLRAQLRGPRPRTRPPRKRYRCPECFREALYDDQLLEHFDGRCQPCGVPLEPVARRRPRSKAKADSAEASNEKHIP